MDPEQVKVLYDYSKFHIGLYSALIGVLLAVARLGVPSTSPINAAVKHCLYLTVAFFIVAAMAGGTIASTISQDSASVINDKRIGPVGLRLCKARTWAAIEHNAFWLGVAVALVGICK
jgi:hypothetical protein